MRGFAQLFLITISILLTSCTLFKERPAKTFHDATGGEGLERVFWTNVKNKKWQDLDRVISSNFVATLPDNQLGRDEWFNRIKQMELQEFSIGELRVELHGTTMVVTYQITLNGKQAGQPLAANSLRRMSVWQQQKSGWVLIAQSSSG
ncbi:MAG TPA: nuclear transport factor 2 family protein [Terriglobales bacterium]|jgi:Domain of unknown function (DUF4440)|nr:nuclear transport factor 2 family protein [Terriglobales bacterium]